MIFLCSLGAAKAALETMAGPMLRWDPIRMQRTSLPQTTTCLSERWLPLALLLRISVRTLIVGTCRLVFVANCAFRIKRTEQVDAPARPWGFGRRMSHHQRRRSVRHSNFMENQIHTAILEFPPILWIIKSAQK